MSTSYKFYSLKNILAKKAQYNVIFGERSNGKSFAVEEYGITEYCNGNGSMAIIRRWKEDFRGKRAQHMFDGLIKEDKIRTISHGKFSTIIYRNWQWYLANVNEDGEYIIDTEPFAFAFCLADVEHDKSVSFPNITTILFDEFLTRGYYLNDEFVIFMNVLSTIIRQRNNVKIFMLGNTVNKYCPYFAEMGLKHAKDMKEGTIDVYTYGESNLRVAVERTGTSQNQSKKSDVYFAFDNPKLQMIKGGAWELDLYPHLPIKYKESNIILKFFIRFDGQIVQCNVINVNESMFVFCHMKTTEIKDEDNDLIYQLDSDRRFNIRYSFTVPIDNIDNKILKLYRSKKFFYQSNDVGEVVRNYIKTTKEV